MPPKIVILDGHTANPGDLDWQAVTALGDCTIHERTAPGDVIARARGAAVILTNKVRMTREVIGQLPDLRYIGVLATGVDAIDLAAAAERGIVVSNVPAYSTASVAQLTFALLLELTHHAGHHAAGVREGAWSRSADFAYWDFPLVELAGLKMGLIGFGAIAQAVARIALAFGMQVVATRRDERPSEVAGVELVSLETLLRTSDVVSVHCPLTPETRGLINAARLAAMKPTAWLLNTSRGPVIVEQDLADALNGGRIAGAGLDVLSSEPPPAENPLLTAKNCLITPHIAWATRAARSRLVAIVAANIRAFLDGAPRNVVRPPTAK
jgi:glycerate dehydrogenase